MDPLLDWSISNPVNGSVPLLVQFFAGQNTAEPLSGPHCVRSIDYIIVILVRLHKKQWQCLLTLL